MTQAAFLYSRDFKDIAATPAQAPLNGQPVPLPPADAPQPMFPLMPVADVLITERRTCRACGSVHEAQSDRVHRLLSSCAGDPFKRVLRPRKPTEQPLDMKVRHTVEVLAEHCAICWTTTHFASQAWEITPERPRRKTFTAMGLAMEEAKKEKLRKPSLRATLKALPLDKALDLL